MRCKPIALATLLACSVNTPTFALSTDNDAPPTLPTPVSLQGATPAQPQQATTANNGNQNIASTLSFADMGATGGLTLTGQQLQNGVSFNLPNDLVITDAHISLNVQVNRSDVSGENLHTLTSIMV